MGIAPSLQARWLAQSAYLAWRDPRVRTIAHYEWRDEKVSRKAATGTRAYASWQSGLYYVDGRAQTRARCLPHPI